MVKRLVNKGLVNYIEGTVDGSENPKVTLAEAGNTLPEDQKGIVDLITKPICGLQSHFWMECSLGKI